MSEIKKIIVNGIDGQREYGLEDSVARQDVQEIVAGAPEELDSFREAFEALAGVNTAVEANAKAIEDETERARGAEEKLAENVNVAMAAVEAEKERAQGAEAAINDKVAAAAGAQAAALTQAVSELNDKIDNEGENGKVALAAEIEKIKDGDTIAGQAREIHSRNGKTVADSFLARTTAGSGTIGDGVASLKSVGGNIVKNLVDGTFGGSYIHKDVKSSPSYPQLYYYASNYNFIINHVYYFSATVKTDGSGATGNNATISINTGSTSQYSNGVKDMWHNISIVGKYNTQGKDMFIRGIMATYLYVIKPLVIDLTEMFGAGNEPNQATCDRLFGTMDALPQGLSIANPTEFKSIGFNQFNPDNVLEGKAIDNNAIVSGDKKIAVIPCLPCKVGIGENNGYCIHGDFVEDIKVYLTPLNPREVDGELYMHELTKDATTDTYVPLIKGYMLVEVPTTANLCAHFLWSEDKCERDSYEPYFESKIALPDIPQMSEWGLAGVQSSGTLACDEIDFEKGVYRKKIGCVDLGSLTWEYYNNKYFYSNNPHRCKKGSSAICDRYSTDGTGTLDKNIPNKTIIISTSTGVIIANDTSYTDSKLFKASLQDVMLYYELAEPEEYPLPKVDNNYISSDYGVEQFDSVVLCNSNNLYYMRSLAGETRNFLDRMYDNTAKTDAKEVADYITSGIEGNKELATNAPNLALRALYIAAGAEYNDSGADKTKTAPWGETVTHKAGHYYLNGLGDITEEQMMDIYNAPRSITTSAYAGNGCRTFIINKGTASVTYPSLKGVFKGANFVEAIGSGSEYLYTSGGCDYMFYQCAKLKHIIVKQFILTYAKSIVNMFFGCASLITVKIDGLRLNLSLKDSPVISKESVLYIIQKAAPSSAITLTLHPDAYARLNPDLAENADIKSALEAQPLITLASA